MRILFIVSNVGFMDPLGVAYLSAVARDLGHERYLCILAEQSLTQRVEDVKPDVLAYSFNSCDATEVFYEHGAVRHKGIFTIMGGSHPTLYPESFRESGADAYCVGEGESAFADVLIALELGRPIDHIPNIITHKQRNDVRPLLDLGTLSLPDRGLVLDAVPRLSRFPRKTFLTSRGCPHQCTYCFNARLRALYAGKGPWIRRFPVEAIIRQIKNVRTQHSLNFVKFDDDNFAVRPDAWLEEFTERYRREIGLPFNCLIRLESASNAMLHLLKQAGCYSITTSVDSANQRIREEVLRRRGGTNQDIVDAMRRIRGHGINLFVNYITGIPGAVEKDELRTLDLNHAGGVTYANYTTLVPFRGTALWDYCRDRRVYDDPDIPTSLLQGSKLKGFTTAQLRTQRNVLMLGAYSCMLPVWLVGALVRLPNNPVFKLMYSFLKSSRISTKIYKVNAGFVQQARVTIRATLNDLKELA